MTDGRTDQPPGSARRRSRWWSVLAVVLLLAGLVPVVSWATGRLGNGPWGLGRPSTAPVRPPPSPAPGDPPEVARRWVGEHVTVRLTGQAGALLRGDEAGFLSVVADGATGVRAELGRRYAALRALRVTLWRPELIGPPELIRPPAGAVGAGRPRWSTSVRFHHCFVTTPCRSSSVVLDLEWADGADGLRLVRVGQSPAAAHGPRPWEAGDLVAAVGRRTMVATTRAQRARLAQLLDWAEAAATVADRQVVAGDPPERYLVFLAGPAEWQKWYGGGLPPWTSGYAVPLPQGQFEVVLNPAQLTPETAPEVLRHELTHVASLPDGGYADAGNWWLAEGLADVAAADGRSASAYPGLPDIRRLVADGQRWQGRFDVAEPSRTTDSWEVSARYGIAYLAVHHLAERFGRRELLTFFRRVVHERQQPQEVAPEVFGRAWSQVRADCERYILQRADAAPGGPSGG